MKRPTLAYLTAIAVLLAATSGLWNAGAQEESTPAPGDSAAVRSPEAIAAERDSLAKVVLASIAGKEDLPADSVFQNLEVLKGIPASRVPAIMNMGFGRSLGVSCDHCHKVGEWADDSNPKKQVARDMMLMVQAINRDLLGQIQNLESEKPAVNCTMCHRGEPKPSQKLVQP